MSELQTHARAPSFIDLYSRGEASADDIDDFVDRWHDAREPGPTILNCTNTSA